MTLSEFYSVLKKNFPKPLHVLDSNIPKSQFVAIDLSEENNKLLQVNVSSSLEFSKFINNYLKQHNAQVAYGGYNEIRNIYKRSVLFDSDNQKRNIHLGLDFWCDSRTPIYAPLKGTVHSFKNNNNYGDYGPTLILEHQIAKVKFYTLYGHLSLNTLNSLKIGKSYRKGEQIATLGDVLVNGDYPPHLHFQIIRDLQGYFGDYPGVCSQKDSAFYLDNCPDPKVLFGF